MTTSRLVPRLPAIIAFAAVWLVLTHLQMSALCEGFFDFILLLLAAPAAAIGLGLLAAFRAIRRRTFVLCLLALVLTLPASIAIGIGENYLADRNVRTITTALHRYRSEHGVFPQRLSQLEPRYLDWIPSAIVLLWVREPVYHGGADSFEVHYQLVCAPRQSYDAAEEADAADAGSTAP